MVKKIKNKKNKQNETKSKTTKSNKEDKDKNIINEAKNNDSTLLKNIKQKREFAKHKVKDKSYNKIFVKKSDKNLQKEKEESAKKENIKKKEEQKDLDLNDDNNNISEEKMEENEEEQKEIEEEGMDEENGEKEGIEENEEEEGIEDNEEKEDIEENEEEEEQSKEGVNEQNNEEEEEEKEHKDINLLKNSISEHYYTFQYPKDLYTLLYTSLIFKWIDTTKIIILCNTPKEGYKIDIFLRQLNFNTIYLDKEMPLNTNNHFYSQFLKNIYQICIVNLEYSEKSKNFPKEILNQTKVPITIIYFDCFSKSLLEYQSFHPNTRAIYHFISNKDNFLDAYENLDENINFNEFIFDKEQVEHLRYRAEDMINGIRKSDIKKEKKK